MRMMGQPPYPRWVDWANQELGEWNRKLCKGALEYAASTRVETAAPEDEPVVLKAFLAGLHKEEVTNGREYLLYRTALQQRELSVASELFDHILAGQETAGVTLTYLTWHLSKNQDIQRKLQAELLALEPSMRADGGKAGSVPHAKLLDALPTLHAVVMETLRLHAALPGPLPRQTPYPSSQIGPYKVPGGVRIAALAHTLHRNEAIFPEPERWDHTRWLEENVDEEKRNKRNRQFWAFSSGGRMCIGSNFAMQGKAFRPLLRSRVDVV